MPLPFTFDNHFATLPPVFYTQMPAEGFAKEPYLVHGNPTMAKTLGLPPDCFQDADFTGYFTGNKPIPGSKSLAMAYAGHQFGVWAGQLGDGRALLLGQVKDSEGQSWDIQLKGSGVTPYSRMGDGRAVLRSCIREYLCGEALDALGIPTTRSLCIIGTGESVRRETWEPGTILTRLSPSHVRFGHFEYAYHLTEPENVTILADYTIAKYFPGLSYTQWFAEVVKRTAHLMAQWQAVGFAHGVMNTDNMSILGLTLDYGPFGFMEAFEPGFVCNHSDHAGRYAFNQQPSIAFWNLHALAVALEPLFPIETAKEILQAYQPEFLTHYQSLMMKKLGLSTPSESNLALLQVLLGLMSQQRADYTLTFRGLAQVEKDQGNNAWLALFNHSPEAQDWLSDYLNQLEHEPEACRVNRKAQMNAVNPKYVLRNWVAETAIRAAEDEHDYSVLDTIFTILQTPFDEHPEHSCFAAPAPAHLKSLCVSCSS